MLRITIHHTHDDLTLKLEGRLAGPWVGELEACWVEQRATFDSRRWCVDLRGVSHVDDRGRELMARLHADGAHFVASGCVMPGIVREIAAGDDRSCLERI